MQFEVKQKDILAQSSTKYIVDLIEYEKGHLVYKFQGGLYTLDIDETSLSLVYETKESKTVMTSKNRLGNCVVENAVGSLEFELFVLKQSVNDNQICLEYKLFQQGMMVSHFIYEWKGR